MTNLPGLAALLACLALPAGAQVAGTPADAPEDTPPPSCEVTSSSTVIRVAVCDRTGTDAQLAVIGKAACAGVVPCGVWFWTDAADAPATAPENHDGLTQVEVTSSLGVFVAEQDMFVRIDKVAK